MFFSDTLSKGSYIRTNIQLQVQQPFFHIYDGSVGINWGCYMVALRYKVSLLMLKNISRVSAVNKWNIFNMRREICFSKKPCNFLLFVIWNSHYNTFYIFGNSLKISGHFLKISEDYQWLLKISKEDPKMFWSLYTNKFKCS